MLAARIHRYRAGFVVEEVPAPSPGPGEVVVRVLGAGFCHSDVHICDGEIQVLPRFPVILGHENAGIVSAIGAGVTTVREGDAVVIHGGWGCGHCAYCIAGLDQSCATAHWSGASDMDGGYAQFIRVPSDRYLVKLSRLDPREAAPLADAALTPYRAVHRAMPFLMPDHPVLTVGVGGLGQYGIRLLRALTGCPIIAVDISEQKLQLAKEMGADLTLHASTPDLAGAILRETGGRGVCASFDFVGTDATLDLCVRSTRAGGKVSQIGLAGGAARLKVLENARFEVTFEATLWGTIQELREVVALVENRRIGLIPVEYQPLTRINDVLGRVRRGEVEGRIVITPND